MKPGRHLAKHELVDALDGLLAEDRTTHLLSCGPCAAQVADLRAIAARAADLEVPEPPAFFWTQLSARVRSAVADHGPVHPPVAGWRSWWRPTAALLAAAGLIALVSSLAGLRPHRAVGPPAPVAAVHTPDDAQVTDDALVDVDRDDAWAMVTTLAEELDHEEMDGEGLSARPGAVDQLTLGLSEPERVELIRLLEEQLKGRRKPGSAS